MCPEAQRGPGTVLEPHSEAGLKDPSLWSSDQAARIACAVPVSWGRPGPPHPACHELITQMGLIAHALVCCVHSLSGFTLWGHATENAVVVV